MSHENMEFEVTMADITGKKRNKLPVDASSSASTSSNLCRKCQLNPPIMTIRTEKICKDCFILYVRGKFNKHMAAYRVKRGTEINRRRIMASISSGMSSMALLELLHWHRSLQLERAKRAEYDVLVVHIDQSGVDMPDLRQNDIQKLQEKFPDFEFRLVLLEDIYNFGMAVEEEREQLGETGTSARPSVEGETNVENTKSTSSLSTTSLEKLTKLISSLPSRTSQVDIISILRTRLLVETAKASECEGILMGENMTRIAQMIMAEVTKGRGHAVPWLRSDGPTPYGTTIRHPLRDLSKEEIRSYIQFSDLADIIPPEILSSTKKPVVNSKALTIDDIVGQFFEDLSSSEHLVSNVVKTADKLRKPSEESRFIEEVGICEICGLPMNTKRKVTKAMRGPDDHEGKEIDAGDEEKQEGNKAEEKVPQDPEERIYAMYDVHDALPALDAEGISKRRCYACRRTILGSASKISWPV